MFRIDPESFRGKLYLMVIDKIIIGALIAVAFVIYDQWKMQEKLIHDAAQKEADLVFKRAEYIKQLTPIVLNNQNDVLVRGHALRALVETESVTSSSAVFLAQKLLLAGLLAAGGGPEKSPTSFHPTYDRGHFLLSTMLQAMPEGIADVLRMFERTGKADDHEKSNDQIIGDAKAFWRSLVLETIRTYPDDELGMLNDDSFLVEHIKTLKDHTTRRCC